MQVTRFSAARYACALPDGAWAVQLFGQHVATSEGTIPRYNGQDVLYLDLRHAENGVLQVCAGSSLDAPDHALEWTGTAWRQRGPAYGTHPVLFAEPTSSVLLTCPNGLVVDEYLFGAHVATLPIQTGSQGLRYVCEDGTVVTADTTYYSPALQLCEFTEWPDVAIGQGVEDGLHVRFKDEPRPRIVEPGRVRNVRAYRTGDQFGLAFCREDLNSAAVCWPTLAELRAFPFVPAPVDTPPIEPPVVIPPPIPIPPTPEIPPMSETAEQKRERMTAMLAGLGGFCPNLDTYQERYRQTVIECEGIPDYTEADVIKHHVARKGQLYQ